MFFVVFKASDHKYVDLTAIADIEKLYDKFNEDFIVTNNFWYNESIDTIMRHLQVDRYNAQMITASKLAIVIYDDYVE